LYTTLAYFSRLLDKIGVEMQVVKAGEFKSAVEPYIQTEMSDANRKQLTDLQKDMWAVVRHAVSKSRSISEEQLDKYAEENTLFKSEEELLSYGLVDSLIYQQDMKAILAELTGEEDFQRISHKDMMNLPTNKKEYIKEKIAIVYAEGEINDGGSEGIVKSTFIKTIQEVEEDDNVRAVVLRVNSPGGSAFASEQIWHALTLLKEKKPVVVSMGDYAASGGYYISCMADSIFAQDNTVTGSIGIFGLVPCTNELTKKIGIDYDGVQTHHLSSSNTSMVVKGMTSEERALMQGVIHRGYNLFVSRCAEGRGMTCEDIRKIAEGRIWSGQQAMEIGLVDKIGDIQCAIVSAAQLANVSHYDIVTYPKTKDSLTQMIELLSGTDTDDVLLREVKRLKGLMQQSNLQARLPYDINIK
ncbi:MAG TPA: signal peptide peptidase SppA, partial [Bacteroidales bacterium]|nr:signal peptide peptidase SppA [Bacteroidales bacterium]